VSNNDPEGLLGRISGMDTTPALAEGDPLAPAPLTGVLVGYGRVSTRDQNLARQQEALTAAGCAKNADRPGVRQLLTRRVPGPT
jgi:hypothetical protein